MTRLVICLSHRRETLVQLFASEEASSPLQHPPPITAAPVMATFRRFRPDDVNKFSKCNLDPLTETYELAFYLQYHAKWPSMFQVCEDMDGNIIGYSTSNTTPRFVRSLSDMLP